MATEYGGRAASSARPGTGSRRRRRGRARTGLATAAAVLVLGVAGLGVSLVGVAMQLMPRHFSAHQQRQILDWEAASRWRVLPAGTIFPATVRYQAPVGGPGKLTLTAGRIGIARQASCPAATDPVVAAVLVRDGCQAMLRATYVDETNSYVVTVGVATFPGTEQAAAARRELAGPTLTAAGGAAPGVRTVAFKGTPAAWFSNARRQISGNKSVSTYVIFYTVGYGDDRSYVPVTSDRYTYAEMTSLGTGVAQAVQSVLGAPLHQPRCPGTPGC